MDYAIDVEKISKSFQGKAAVTDLSMRIKKGSICGFLGPNGSGKTTSLRILCGLIKPDTGQGNCLDFRLPTESHLISRKIGYMSQYFSLYDYLTVLENLQFSARIFNSGSNIDNVIELLRLKKYLHFKAGNLSGGWQKKLSLATALLSKPKLLLLDEPTAGVDPSARHEFWNILERLSSEGTTILVSTHYMDEAERCNQIAYLANGRLIANGSIEEIIDNSQLLTWTVKGKNIHGLKIELSQKEGVDHVSQRGNSLYICGTYPKSLLKAIRPYQYDFNYSWQGTQTSIEDVFIYLMHKTKDTRFG